MIVLLVFESFNGSRDSTTSLYILVPLRFIGSISHESQLEINKHNLDNRHMGNKPMKGAHVMHT